MKISLLIVIILLSGCANTSKKVKQAKLDINMPVVITQQGTVYPNSAGGVDFRADLVNTSNKTIKYVDFLVRAKNRVGDFAVDTVSGEIDKVIRLLGPIAPGENARHPFIGTMRTWHNVWYNQSITCGGIVSLAVTYMNNEKVHFKDAENLIDTYRCKMQNSDL